MATKLPVLDTMEIDELMALRENVEAQIKSKAKARQSKLKAEMEALEPYLKVGKTARGAGGKVPAKYQDPKTGKTWSGRGRPPTWVLAYEEKGKSRNDLLIR